MAKESAPAPVNVLLDAPSARAAATGTLERDAAGSQTCAIPQPPGA
jgi:hypothetical protein